MPSLKEIKKAVSSALKKLYPKVNIYGADTVEGYSKPCFFVYATQTFSEATKNAIHKNVEVEIDYIQNSPDESKAMDFFEKMENTFCQKLKVGDRYLSTSELLIDFSGEHSNIPVFTFDVEFWDAIEKEPDNSALMGDFRIKTEVER